MTKITNLLCLQHVPFEGPAAIAEWAKKNDISLVSVHCYRGDPLPALRASDALVVLGGPMSVHDEEQYVWLGAEKRFIKSALESGNKVIGICLGAQLIAEQLGATVTKNTEGREIGWFPVEPAIELSNTEWAKCLSERFIPLHWHGEQFSIPVNCLPIGASDACENQGFIFNAQALALQCHLEASPESVAALIEHCGEELDGSPWVQEEQALRRAKHPHDAFAEANLVLYSLLDKFIVS